MADTEEAGSNPQDAPEPAYTETAVEYVENRQRRVVFAALVSALVILVLILASSTFAVLYLTKGSGAPAQKDVPEGITWVRSIYGWGKTAETSLAKPTDVAVAPNGTIWTISAAQMIVGFNPDGTLKKVIKPTRGWGKGQVDTLEGIDVGPDGIIYVTDQGKNSVQRFTQNGEWLGEWAARLPIEVAVSGEGDEVAVTGEGSYGILSVTEDTVTVVGTWGTRGNAKDSLDLPHGVAFGDNDVVFVSDTHNARVKAYSKSGQVIWTAGGTPQGFGSSAEASASGLFQLPTGMTIDNAKRIVVVDPFGFNMTVLEQKSGRKLAQYGDSGANDGSFAYPTGVDYDPARDWFVVADTANNRLQILRIPGSGGTPAAALRRNFAGPVWICCIPLFLLLAALVPLALRRRAQRGASRQAPESVEIPA